MAKVTNWVVYTLNHPETKEVRYVGWTLKKPEYRLRLHINDSKSKPNSHRSKWITSLVKVGLTPEIELVESGTGYGWAEAEQRWIAHYRAIGARLTNATDGGEGTPGYVPTAETRALLSKRGKGRKMLPHVKAILHAAALVANTGRKMSPEERAHLTAAVKGKKQTPEHRAKVSAAHKGRKYSDETRAKMSASAKIKVFTPEHRARMSAAQKRRNAANREAKAGGR